MAYCQNCGGEMADGAKFCPSCGTAAGSAGDENVRKTSYEGEIKKCPNCGSVISAMQAFCPDCGFEL
ncbi:MAG: zinc ribbon domain-containing protein, partial [Spirochaetales bacterium]|nr:zinc ribbon domain-containing protein [Spirochaetales bacterium]